ncbi:MAG: CDP-glycerol glycerophosphotransferase family protein [Lachnospiraceae bacterium]|nr:CDP-glycerol glycerophosphotransferase family protein [Lachnospiraceae bacterium]
MGKLFKYLRMFAYKFLPRRRDVIVFGAWLGERFTDNSMQLFLEASEYEELTCYWVTKSKEIYRELKKQGLNVCMFGSKKSKKIHKKAGFAVVSNGISDVEHEYLGGAVIIDLWHGIPLKKIAFDNNYEVNHDSPLQKLKRFFKYLPYKKIYYVAPSENFTDIYMSAFRTKRENILTLGQPRNDVFFEGKARENFPGKKIILYCPTHRKEGEVEINIQKIFPLDKLEKFLEENDYYFMIKKHFYHREEITNLSKYKRIFDITQGAYDIQELIMEAKLLITDYSSIYIDYLLLNKPLLFYCYDLEDYLKNDREMYFDYNAVTPGNKATTKSEFMEEIEKYFEEQDAYEEEDRESLKNFFYCKRGQQNVGRVIISYILDGRLG